MISYLLDTNVLLRLILKDEQSQLAKIQDLLEQSESQKVKLFCSGISIFEIVFVLMGKTYNLDKIQTVKVISTLLKLKVIEFEDLGIFEMALKIFSKQNISFPDTYLIAKSRIQKLEFFSFDNMANKAYKNL